jgi:hypothetical protein
MSKAQELIEEIKTAKPTKSGETIISHNWVSLILSSPKPFGSDKKCRQITVRYIRISEEYQQQEIFTELVKYLLETYGYVQLFSVQSELAMAKLNASSHWNRVSPGSSSWYRSMNHSHCFSPRLLFRLCFGSDNKHKWFPR